MKKVLLALLLLLQCSLASAQNLQAFLKSCAYGTLLGATAGVVTMAFTDKPGQSWSNVAKGASLGLYGGIIFGAYQMSKEPTTYQQPDFAVIPVFESGKVEGVQITKTILNF